MSKKVPKTLYRYYAKIDYVSKLISNGHLHFASPNSFNDPYDFFPSISGISKYAEILCAIKGINKSEVKKKIKNWSHQNKLKLVNSLQENFKVCCFSEIFNSFNMWSYYANGFKGCCIGFDTKRMSDAKHLGFTFEVKYRDARPKFLDMKHKNILEQIAILVAYKNTEYQKEKEWRCVKFLNHDNQELSCPSNGIINVDTNLIREVIPGNNMSSTELKTIKSICREKNIRLYQIKISSAAEKYVLEKRKL